MAFTLETTLVVPLSLSLLMGLTGLTRPILNEVDSASRLAVRSQIEQLSLEHLYKDGEYSQTLQTSPQHVIEWIELFSEAKRLLSVKGDTTP